MKIRKIFENAQRENRKLFIPYLTCGDPDLSTTAELILALEKIGADIIEVGVPFSDPIADGVTNQLAAQRALKNAVSLKDCCALIKTLREQQCHVPIVLFTYFNPIFRMGLENFASLASTCGVDGVLVVDLPVEEASDFIDALSHYNLDRIFLATPTTEKSRLTQIAEACTAFLYYVSRVGITGTHDALSNTLEKKFQEIKQIVKIPIAVGFGISNTAQARSVAAFADGVIVGSALVKTLEHADKMQATKNFIALATELSQEIHHP